MKRTTHTLLGAAVALPTAVSAPPLIAIGCLCWGMVGGGLPDWFDLRSEWRSTLRLRHRGASHGILFLAIVTAAVWGIGEVFQRTTVMSMTFDLRPTDTTVRLWTICVALGVLSHLVSDACTHAGIQPLLPFARTKVWVLPEVLRGRSDGPIDTVARLVALVVIAIVAFDDLRPLF